MNTTQTGPYPRVIGIHLALPHGSHWTPLGPESRMLQRLLIGGLVQVGQYKGDDSGNWHGDAFWGQFFAMIPVADFSAALRCVAEELAAIRLLEGAQLAWLDPQEGIWRNERPLPEIVPFAKRLADFAAFCVAVAIELTGPNSAESAKVRQKADRLNTLTGLNQPPILGES